MDMCTKHLIRLLTPRCLEWGHILELIRARLDGLWRAAGALMRPHGAGEIAAVAAPLGVPWDELEHALRPPEPVGKSAAAVSLASPTTAQEQQALLSQIDALRAQLVAAELRASAAEARVAELSVQPKLVALQSDELRANRRLLDEQSQSFAAYRYEMQASAERAAREREAAPRVIVLAPEPPQATVPTSHRRRPYPLTNKSTQTLRDADPVPPSPEEAVTPLKVPPPVCEVVRVRLRLAAEGTLRPLHVSICHRDAPSPPPPPLPTPPAALARVRLEPFETERSSQREVEWFAYNFGSQMEPPPPQTYVQCRIEAEPEAEPEGETE